MPNSFGENSYAGRLISNNISDTGWSIVKSSEIGGHRMVVTKSGLYNLTIPVLSEDTTGNDAIGQLWYVQAEDCFYQLVNWQNRKNSNGWKKFAVTEDEIYGIFGYTK